MLASCHTTLVSLIGALEMCVVQPGWCLDLELAECTIRYKRGTWNTNLVKCVWNGLECLSQCPQSDTNHHKMGKKCVLGNEGKEKRLGET